jgi:hypothetical protein
VRGSEKHCATQKVNKKTAGLLDRRLRVSAAQHAVEEALELPAPDRMLQFANRLGLNLPHSRVTLKMRPTSSSV